MKITNRNLSEVTNSPPILSNEKPVRYFQIVYLLPGPQHWIEKHDVDS